MVQTEITKGKIDSNEPFTERHIGLLKNKIYRLYAFHESMENIRLMLYHTGFGHYCISVTPEHITTITTDPIYNIVGLHNFEGIIKNGNSCINLNIVLLGMTGSGFDMLDKYKGYNGEKYKDPNHVLYNMFNREIIKVLDLDCHIYIFNGPYSKKDIITK
jgi:hypothetical protein